MKVKRAPVYVRAFMLSEWLLSHHQRLVPDPSPELSAQIQRHAIRLLEVIAVALTFRHGRRARLIEANEDLVRLRMCIRLGAALTLYSAKQRRYVMAEIEEVGRMIGGWLKYEIRGQREAPEETGWDPGAI